MIITSFEYKEIGWKLNPVYFKELNLIVGRNAVGKSRTMNAMAQVAKFVLGNPKSGTGYHFCKITFGTDEDERALVYSYSYDGTNVLSESMETQSGEVIIMRDAESSKVRGESVNPPQNKLIIQSQRDTEKYPEFEIVTNWAEHTRGVTLGNVSASISFRISDMFEMTMDIDTIMESMDDESKRIIIEGMRQLGYQIENIRVVPLTDKFKLVVLKEQGLQIPILTNNMSNGMLRAFYVLTYLRNVSSKEGAKTLMIDDLGEGLDFERSSKLSQYLFDFCKEHGIQLIVSSNDNFLMNVISLKYWIILKRTGEVVSSITEKTHPKLFRKFKFTGLSNFDLYKTDFIDKFLAQEAE